MRFLIGMLCIVLGFSGSNIRCQGSGARKINLDFEGTRVFSKQELLAVANECLARDSRPEGEADSSKVDYCLHKVKFLLFAKGYLRAEVGKRRQEQTEDGLKTVVSVEEGALYRMGEIRIEGPKLYSPAQIREMLDLKTGDIADGDRISGWLYERVKKAYSNFGYIQFVAEVEPKFNLKDEAKEGVVDLLVTIDEGEAFTIRSIKFEGNGNVAEDALLREMQVRSGEVFNKDLFDQGLRTISHTDQFEVIDVDKDVDYKWDDKNPRLDLTIHLKKRLATRTSMPGP